MMGTPEGISNSPEEQSHREIDLLKVLGYLANRET